MNLTKNFRPEQTTKRRSQTRSADSTPRNLRIALAVAATLTTLPVSAATLTWDPDGALPLAGGDGVWNTSDAFWTADGGSSFTTWSNATPDSAIFNGPIGTVTLATAITAGTVTLNSAGYTIDLAGFDFTLGSTTGTGVHSATTITNSSGTPATFTAATLSGAGPTLSGNMAVTLSGTSNWTATAAHDFTGTFTFRPTATATILPTSTANFGSASGQISLDASALTGALTASINWSTPDNTQIHTYTRDIVLTQGATAFAQFQVNGAKEITLAGVISGGTAGGKGLRYTSGQGNIILAGANTYQGVTEVTGQSGMLTLAHPQALGTNAQGTSGVTMASTLQTLAVRGGINLANTNPISINSGSGQPASGYGHVHSLSGDNRLSNDITWGSSTTKFFGAEAGSQLTLDGVLGSGGSGIYKVGYGTIVLSGVNNFGKVNGSSMTFGVPHINATAIYEGTLRLDFSGANAPVTDIINNLNASNANAASSLFMRGGTLELTGAPGASNSQRFKNHNLQGTTFAPGASAIVLDKNGAANLQLTLNKVAVRYQGSTVDFTLPDGDQTTGTGGNGITTTTPNTNGILGAFATVSGTDWAASGPAGTNVITPYAAYTDDVWAPGNNTTITSSAPIADSATNSLRFDANASTALTLTGTNTISSGGILVTPAVGANDTAIAGGSIGVDNVTLGGDLIVHQNNTEGKLTIASSIVNSATIVDRSATLGSGNTTVTGLASTADLHTGMLVTGTNVGANARIFSIDSATAITLTVNNVAPGGASDLTFTPLTGLTKSGAGTLVLAENNTYAGETTVAGGILKLEHATAIPGGINSTGGTSNLNLKGGVIGLTAASGDFNRGLGTGAAQVQFTGSGGFAAYGGDRIVNIGGASGSVTFGSNAGNGTFVLTGSALIFGADDSDGTVIFQNPISLRSPNAPQQREFRVLDGVSSTNVDARLTGAITTDGGLTKTGDGTLELAGAGATYKGQTIIEAGTLRLGVAGAVPTDSIVTVKAGTFDLNGINFTARHGGLTLGGGAAGTTSAVTTGAGTLTLATNVIYNGDVADDSGASISGNLALGSVTRTFTVHDSSATASDLTVSAVVSGTGGLSKAGEGTLNLIADNTYTGATTVSAGTLLVSGSLSGASGAVTVEDGGTFGGIGELSRNVTINSGGSLLGGNGTTATDDLSLGGNVTFSNDSIIKLTLGAAGAHSALTRTGGTWAFDFDQSFSFIDAGAAPGTFYDNIIAGLAADPDTTLWTIENPGWVGTFAYDGANVDFTLVAIPEPGAIALVLGGLGCLLGFQRRRTGLRAS